MWYSMKNRALNICLVLAPVFFFAAIAGATTCDAAPQAFQQEPGAGFQGTYANKAWGYSIMIPSGLVGSNNSAGPQHGFGIVLGPGKQRYIYVNGEANSLELSDPADAAIKELEYLIQDKRKITSATITPVRLGRLRGVQLVVAYSCPVSTERHILASVFAIGPGGSPLYEVTLYSLANQYKNDRALLDQMLKSWKYTGY